MLKPLKDIVLASKSPRRQELLSLMGLPFQTRLKEVDESYPPELAPAEIALYIAEKKAAAFPAKASEIIITADTIVALEGEILGKPADKEDAQNMLRKLSGKTHQVYTGVSIAAEGQLHSFFDQTDVRFRPVSSSEIDYYIEHFNPFDKAGSYGVQDWWGLAVVEKITGSYTNVMGLPTEKLYQALMQQALIV